MKNETNELDDQNPPDERPRIESLIHPPLLRPPGSVRLFPAEGAGDTKAQPDWMKELNKKNKEKKERAAQEEKLAREMKSAPVDQQHDDDGNPNGCCIMF